MSVYTSCIVLKGAGQPAVADYLRQEGRHAVVTPTVNGVTALADRLCDECTDAARSLAQKLSSRFGCPAIAFHNHSDDVLYYWVYQEGEERDAYDSSPDYFDFQGEHDPPRGPIGGDAAFLCAAFGSQGQEARVEAILRRELQCGMDEDELEEVLEAFKGSNTGMEATGRPFVEAMQSLQERMRSGSLPVEVSEDTERKRHLELLNALEIPAFCVGLVYEDALADPASILDDMPGIELSPGSPEDAALEDRRLLTGSDPAALLWVGSDPEGKRWPQGR